MTAPASTVDRLDMQTLRALPDVHPPVTFTAIDALSHGAGTAGNTQLLRTEPVLLPDGRRVSVPYVSGASIRHTLRDALAWHLVRLLDIDPGSLSDRVSALLWSGGALTAPGAQTDLAMMRRTTQLLPGLSAMGYSAKSDMTESMVRVGNAYLMCAENAHRAPGRLAGHPHLAVTWGGAVATRFGTRHDITGSPAGRMIEIAAGADGILDLIATPAPKPAKAEPADNPMQMIFETQAVKPGAVLWSEITARVPTPGHLAALAVAIDEAAPERDGQRILHLGGKKNQGYAAARLDIDLAPLGDLTQLRAAYEANLVDNRADILALMTAMVD